MLRQLAAAMLVPAACSRCSYGCISSLSLPRLVIAVCFRPAHLAGKAARRPVSQRRARHVLDVRLLPRPWMVGFLGWKRVDRVMQPAEPLWRNLAGLRQALINDPSAWPSGMPCSSRVLVIAIAGLVLSDKLAACARIKLRRKRRAVPPCEEIADQTHSHPRSFVRFYAKLIQASTTSWAGNRWANRSA